MVFKLIRKGFVGYRQSLWTKKYTHLGPGVAWAIPFVHTVTVADAAWDAAKHAVAVETLRAEAAEIGRTTETEEIAAECARIVMLTAALGNSGCAAHFLLERKRLAHLDTLAAGAKATYVFGREKK